MDGVFWYLDHTQASTESGSNDLRLKLTQPGDDVLEFFVQDKPFYTFPFSLSVVNSDDPYHPDDWTFMEGAWNDYAYLHYPDADPDQQLYFKVWLRHKGRERRHKAEVDVKLMRGGKVIAESGGGGTFWLLKPSWEKSDFALSHPQAGGSAGAVFRARDLLKQNGKYSIRVRIAGKLYGTYSFTVSEGKIELQDRQLREGTDPLEYIEGGQQGWWLKRG